MAYAPSADIARHDSTFHWGAGVGAGLIAGLVFLIAEMGLVWLVNGQSPWGPPRMIVAMVMGRDVLPPPATFELTMFAVAGLIHFALAVVYGLIAVLLMRRLSTGLAMLIGLLFGVAIYYVSFYPIADAMFPWFADARGGVSLFSHALFGAVLGLGYAMLRRPH